MPTHAKNAISEMLLKDARVERIPFRADNPVAQPRDRRIAAALGGRAGEAEESGIRVAIDARLAGQDNGG